MLYYSTNQASPLASLSEAVTRGLAPDGGLYMPETIAQLPQEFFDSLPGMSFVEMSQTVARALFPDMPADALDKIVADTLAFDTPVVKVSENIYTLELFHGPTLAFKDVGARFMARLLSHFAHGEEGNKLNVLVATSGDTGSAVANGFLGVEGINVFVLYPKGKVSKIQECQFTTLGQNITALEVDGTFDDCQRMVKEAFVDDELNDAMRLTSANSINIARLLPQSFYYFRAIAQMQQMGLGNDVVICVPSGNFGNITAGLVAKRMGLPVKRFIAANNANGVFYDYLNTGKYRPLPSVATIANAMDVGAPSNFARIMELYSKDHSAVCRDISGFISDDEDIRRTIAEVYEHEGYILDPHGACGYRALKHLLETDETGIFLETAHPAKFCSVINDTISREVEIPERLAAFMRGTKQSTEISNEFNALKAFLLNGK